MRHGNHAGMFMVDLNSTFAGLMAASVDSGIANACAVAAILVCGVI